mmetsp:Transcript_14476/g.44697  ORF Transcript_14476/g.44697 Transcript_14476/m.44697 type:complete len:92 (-) Transcript_14476:199-474(-)
MEKPQYKSCTETSISFKLAAAAAIEYKEYPDEWTACKTLDAAAGDVTVEGLNPGSTYQFRVAAGDDKGPELVVDTMAPNCTPKPKTCCIVS